MRRMITTKQMEALKNITIDSEGTVVNEQNIEFNGNVEFTGNVSGVGGGHKIVIDYVDDTYNFKVIHSNGEEEDVSVDSEMPTPIVLTDIAAVIAGADVGEKTIYLSLDSGCGISQYEGT